MWHKKLSIWILLATTPLSFAYSWNGTAHRIIAEIAQRNLSETAQVEIKKILKGRSLAQISNWADEALWSGIWRNTGNWHHINFTQNPPKKCNYWVLPTLPSGDLLFALAIHEQNLRGTAQFYEEHEVTHEESLSFLVHLIADLHQPLHVGYAKDKGGKDTEVAFPEKFRSHKEQPLHRLVKYYPDPKERQKYADAGLHERGVWPLHKIWDKALGNEYLMDLGFQINEHDGLLDSQLGPLVDQSIKIVERLGFERGGNYWTWVQETQANLEGLYGDIIDDKEFGLEINQKYMAKYGRIALYQWYVAGMRTAQKLNSIFEKKPLTKDEMHFNTLLSQRYKDYPFGF